MIVLTRKQEGQKAKCDLRPHEKSPPADKEAAVTEAFVLFYSMPP